MLDERRIELSGPSRIRQILGEMLDNDMDLDIASVAHELGISSAVFRGLLKSDVEFSTLSISSLRALSRLLKMPLGLMYRELGLLGQDDFLSEEKDLDSLIDELYELMRRDDEFSAIAPTTADWAATPLTTKVALCACYERSRGIRGDSPSLNRKLAELGQKDDRKR